MTMFCFVLIEIKPARQLEIPGNARNCTEEVERERRVRTGGQPEDAAAGLQTAVSIPRCSFIAQPCQFSALATLALELHQ